MTLALDPRLIDALLLWQAELGADEYLDDHPVDRFAEWAAEQERRAQAPAASAAAAPRRGAPVMPEAPAVAPKIDPVAVARSEAARAQSLEDLAEIQSAFPHLDLRKGARNFVFSDGRAGARLMVVGEAPGAEEDRQGRPFVGQAGQLLDKMLAAIGFDRAAPDLERAVYITNVLPWRTPGNRDPEALEIEMMRPFLLRHIELAAPEAIAIVGAQAAQTLLGERGITRLRGKWHEVLGRPAMPLLHPAYLIRLPDLKRETWSDLLSLKARLDPK